MIGIIGSSDVHTFAWDTLHASVGITGKVQTVQDIVCHFGSTETRDVTAGRRQIKASNLSTNRQKMKVLRTIYLINKTFRLDFACILGGWIEYTSLWVSGQPLRPRLSVFAHIASTISISRWTGKQVVNAD